MPTKTINFLQYLEEVQAEQYTGRDDEMPEDFTEWFSNRDMEDDFILYITGEYTDPQEKQKFKDLIYSLTD